MCLEDPIWRSRGRLIVFEGGEGAGKSTQLHRLQQWLTQSEWLAVLERSVAPGAVSVVVTREPGGTTMGQQIRQLLLDSALTASEGLPDRTELLLYAADRAQHVETALKPALERGTIVLCDRYTDSTVAYQGYGRGLDLTLIEQLNQVATGGLKADLTLWLDLEVNQGLERAKKRSLGGTELQGPDRMESANLAFHERVRQGFCALVQEDPVSRVRIEASGTEDQVFESIQRVVVQYLQQWYPKLSNP